MGTLFNQILDLLLRTHQTNFAVSALITYQVNILVALSVPFSHQNHRTPPLPSHASPPVRTHDRNTRTPLSARLSGPQYTPLHPLVWTAIHPSPAACLDRNTPLSARLS